MSSSTENPTLNAPNVADVPDVDEKKARKMAEKAAKLEKLRLKKEKQAIQAAAAAKNKAKKEKKPAATSAPAPKLPFTPPGEKKIQTAEMAATYSPEAVEASWYSWWEKQGYFGAQEDRKDKKKYVIVIPPPNVTGSLHMGHALTNAVQDTLVRWRRMHGDDVMWVPGTDHAGIATQRVVENRLWQDGKKTRHDLGREEFTKLVWEWKEKYGSYIQNQLRVLGSSLDWEREVFTMDEKLSKAVVECFVECFDQGLIYRADRLVNWSCSLETAISDIEVDHIDITGPIKLSVPGHDENMKYPFGVLVHFAYKVLGDDGKPTDEEVVVATTRIETMLGDTAVAVHPNDERYKHLHGKFLHHPFVDRRVPVITDGELVDMEFGTGAVKVTPAHDPNDYQAGKRNNLEFITMLNKNGTMNDLCGQFAGMMRFDARYAVIAELKKLDLHRGETPNPMRLGICSRSKDIIEPMGSPQWWMDMKDMGAEAAKVVRDGELEIVPPHHKTTWFYWTENIQDWCISRQLWWGHRVPAYLVSVDGKALPDCDTKSFVAAHSEEAALAKAAKLHGVTADRITLSQDPDVLDTWFSSALFPFSVFGWPEQTADLERFFPTSVLETGHDIIFFWVARMVMMSQKLLGKLPFKRVLLHAMVRDAIGRKMSKSLGNVLDPLDVMRGITLEELHKKLEGGNLPPAEIERARACQATDFPTGIPECGVDAVRFGLCAYMSQGRSINLDVNRVVGYRHFCNKLWNVVRFALTNLPTDEFTPMSYAATRERKPTHVLDRWMLSRVHVATAAANKGLDDFNLGDAVQAIHNLWQSELCDVFLEAIKPLIKLDADTVANDAAAVAVRDSLRETLYTTLETGLRLLHPFMPFVTEELWQRLVRRPDETQVSIMMAPYPLDEHTQLDEAAEGVMAQAMEIVSAIRSMRANYQLTKKTKTPLSVFCEDANLCESLKPVLVSMGSMALCDESALACATNDTKKPPAPGTVCLAMNTEVDIRLNVAGLVDAAALIATTEKKLAKCQSRIEQHEAKVANPNYANVPDDIKAKDEAALEEIKERIKKHHVSIQNFRALAEAK